MPLHKEALRRRSWVLEGASKRVAASFDECRNPDQIAGAWLNTIRARTATVVCFCAAPQTDRQANRQGERERERERASDFGTRSGVGRGGDVTS